MKNLDLNVDQEDDDQDCLMEGTCKRCDGLEHQDFLDDHNDICLTCLVEDDELEKQKVNRRVANTF